MFRIDHPTAVVTLPAIDAAGTPGYFTQGDPQNAIPATVVTKDWANQIQEEIIAVILAAGLTPTKGVNTQLRDSINAAAADTTTNFTLANNQSDAVVTGVTYSGDAFRCIKIKGHIYRKTDSPEYLQAYFELTLGYKVDLGANGTWEILESNFLGDDTGITLEITQTLDDVQLTYDSTNLAGANYVGIMRYKVERFKV
ncbi:MAG: hypothetical protein BWY19_00790 [bacterium ADurb.Bin212]|nr:MAG: hypothetical protein BWY19_00790 [bacterium ADurb.Bin212]